MSTFLSRLSQPGVLVADGGTGTMLQKAGLPRGTAPERWNLENPDAVRNLHHAYVEAGSDIILTNTFGGTRARLQRDKLDAQVHEINQTAARLAREVAGSQVFVFGDVGPLGQLFQPLGPMTPETAVSMFSEQVAGLLASGVDAILIETMSDTNEAKAAVTAVRQNNPDIPLIVTFSFDTKGHTLMGLKPEQAVREIWALSVTAVGANCGRTLSETLTAIQAMRLAAPDALLMAKPNAGLPHTEGGDTVYDVTPEVMAEYAEKFVAEGVKIFGGCCGSDPSHIRAIAKALHG